MGDSDKKERPVSLPVSMKPSLIIELETLRSPYTENSSKFIRALIVHAIENQKDTKFIKSINEILQRS